MHVATEVRHGPSSLDLVGAFSLDPAEPLNLAVHIGRGQISGAIVRGHRHPTHRVWCAVGVAAGVQHERHILREVQEFWGGFVHHRNELLGVGHVATFVGRGPLAVPRPHATSVQQHRLHFKRDVAVGFVHRSTFVDHEGWVGHEFGQIRSALQGVQSFVGVGPNWGLGVHENHVLGCGCGVATRVHRGVRPCVHQVARNAQTWLDVRGDGHVFPSDRHAGSFAKQARVQHPNLGLNFSHDGVLHVGGHHHAAVAFVFGVLHLKDVRDPQAGRIVVRHIQGDVFDRHVATAIHGGDFAVDGVASAFVIHNHLGVHPRNFHGGVDVVARQRPSAGG